MKDIIRDYYLFKKWEKSWERDTVRKHLDTLALCVSDYDTQKFSAKVKNGCIQYNRRLYSNKTLRRLENRTVIAAPNREKKSLLVCTKKSKEFICFANAL
ncbi:hypothetical protein [Treponema pedis]|uniref:hypothetical protein n=1 Tax=Treponema pedis TaxID=409322 RepID=UPI0031438480